MAVVGCTGNLVVLLGRILTPTNNIVHSLYIKNLALSDLLMGIYLFTIAAVDEHYRGVYLQYEYQWRHSVLCNLCGESNDVYVKVVDMWGKFNAIVRRNYV